MPADIGIKLANGEFYPILEENSIVKKRLILTTVHNKQASVHIDFYKSNSWAIADAFYIGSLVVGNIKSKPNGEPSIELVLSSNQNGEILADAVDLDSPSRGEKKFLNVSIKSLSPEEFKIPDFETDYQCQDAPLLGLYESTRDKKKIFWRKLTLIFLCIGVVYFALWFFLSHVKRKNLFHFGQSLEGVIASYPPGSYKPADPPEPAVSVKAGAEPEMLVPPASSLKDLQNAVATTAAPVSKPEPEMIAESVKAPAVVITPESAREPETGAKPEPVQETAVPKLLVAVPPLAAPQIIEALASLPPRKNAPERIRPSPPVASYKIPTTIPRGGAAYKICWGDTLWDISEAFYRNPWLYLRIARFNNIRNPDLIISGKIVRIPPKK